VKVLVIGAGGRESAIAWACRRHGHEVTINADLPPDAIADLVIVGPETALAAGVADECKRRRIPCFGPIAAVARLESSKSYARELATILGLPSPRHFATSSVDDAMAWWRALGAPIVVKQDGLAAGKGVIVPATADETAEAINSLIALGPVVLEERLTGPECSLMVVCDGKVARPLPIAQDHKRIGEGDTGPNTGGMGAYAPAPTGYDAEALMRVFVQPVIDHFAAAGTPYIGVLYAGLMLTADGPRLIEFNCRFGDPEAQAVLPLVESDLAELALACCNGTLSESSLTIREGATCTVVAAAPGYPSQPVVGQSISGLDDGIDAMTDDVNGFAQVFLAGSDGFIVTGGRVLAVTGFGASLAAARDNAYRRMSFIHFDGMQVRSDIGWRSVGAMLTSYAATGVDIDEGTRAVSQMKRSVERTHGPAVLRGVGSFGGAFSGKAIKMMDEPVLVASTDGVGTKVELAARLGRYRGVGADIVNHCVDDVLVQGARPLFFLDYVASSKIHAEHVAEVVTGMAEACEAAGCALLGGETAEMQGVYAPGAFDIAGTLVGIVEQRDMLPRGELNVGDVLIGVASNGPHTNGYSLLRKIFEWLPMDSTPPGFDRPLGETLLVPHRSYLDVLTAALADGRIKALAHITGGGLPENLPRVLPDDCDAAIQLGSWPVPPLFQLVREVATQLDTYELYRTLNMGIGMVLICAAADVPAVQSLIDEPTWVIGRLVAAQNAGPRVQLR
jgi:phosphoribosylamine--glycine ligase/phosphoribosylaminoimidazole synthetase